MPDDTYFSVGKGTLKLKGVQDSGITKKKKKSKKSKKDKEDKPSVSSNSINTDATVDELMAAASAAAASKAHGAQRTKAEMHFMERQRKREELRIMKKASKSHKEKVELFNRNLDSQSEHFDIPKVSWTK